MSKRKADGEVAERESPAKKVSSVARAPFAKEKAVIVLLGGGRMGDIRLRHLVNNPRAHLKYVVDTNEETRKNMAAFANCTGLATPDAAFSDPEVDAVIVSTPTGEHTKAILAAAAAGKIIMCEKPISQHWEEIDTCYQAAQDAGVPLYCAYHRRQDPSFRQVFEAVSSGKIGQLQFIKTTSRDNPVPSLAYLATSGGIYHDCAVHDIDLSVWVAGEKPTEVRALGHAFNADIGKLDDHDTALITLKFPSGAIAAIDISRKGSHGYDQRMEVLGDKGMAQCENQSKSSFVLSTPEGGAQTDPLKYSFPTRYLEAYRIETEHYLDVIFGKCEPYVTWDQCRTTAIVADAATKSSKSGDVIHPKY